LKKIYSKKLDTLKIRIHGNYHLGQILLTGKDIAMNDFSGDPALSYSERRLRRSPFVDLASMIVSIHDVAFEGVMQNQQLHEEDVRRLLPMAGLWAHYVSGWFVRAYKERIAGGAGNGGSGVAAGDGGRGVAAGDSAGERRVAAALLPAKDEGFATLLNYFLVQKAMGVFNEYLRRDPKRLIIPQTILRNVLRPEDETAAAVPQAGGVAPQPSVAPKVATPSGG